MTITLTLEKQEKILNLCHEVLKEDVVTIWIPAVTLAPFYYGPLEMDKAKALRLSNGNYDASVRLSNEAKKKLSWWMTNIMFSL